MRQDKNEKFMKIYKSRTQKERDFMNDYEETLSLSFAMSGQNPRFLNMKYRNISNSVREYLKGIVDNKLNLIKTI
jgi:hypothetical protein